MPALGRIDSTIQRGLRSVERIAGGATLYHVVFGHGARRTAKPIVSFDDIETGERPRDSRWIWAAVIVLHLLLISLPMISFTPSQIETPPPPEGMTIDLVSAPTTNGTPAKLHVQPKAIAATRLPALEDKPSEMPRDGREENQPAPSSLDLPSPPADAAPAPAPQAALLAPVAAAPPPRSGAAKSVEEVRWEGDILNRIGKKKRYPPTAMSKGIEDTILMRLILDRQGILVRAELARSRGNALLDTEVLELAKRASPFPRPPASVSGETVALLVPVEFVITKRR